jgi:hypothetical protein
VYLYFLLYSNKRFYFCTSSDMWLLLFLCFTAVRAQEPCDELCYSRDDDNLLSIPADASDSFMHSACVRWSSIGYMPFPADTTHFTAEDRAYQRIGDTLSFCCSICLTDVTRAQCLRMCTTDGVANIQDDKNKWRGVFALDYNNPGIQAADETEFCRWRDAWQMRSRLCSRSCRDASRGLDGDLCFALCAVYVANELRTPIGGFLLKLKCLYGDIVDAMCEYSLRIVVFVVWLMLVYLYCHTCDNTRFAKNK